MLFEYNKPAIIIKTMIIKFVSISQNQYTLKIRVPKWSNLHAINILGGPVASPVYA